MFDKVYPLTYELGDRQIKVKRGRKAGQAERLLHFGEREDGHLSLSLCKNSQLVKKVWQWK